MYSKVYWIGCNPGHAEAMMAHYDETIVPAIKASDKHVGHHMLQAGENKWLLVSNYNDAAAAEAAVGMVQELVKPMMESFGMTLEVITEGEVTHSY